jgi:lantibiotic leader peptide-processing serine protease
MRSMVSSVLLGLSLTLAAPAFAAGAQTIHSYLIETNGSAGNLAGQVSAAGGTLVHVNPEIGYASAVSDNPGFASSLAQTAGVGTVAQDLLVQWTPTAQEAQVVNIGRGPAPLSRSANPDPAGAYFYACQWNLPKIGAPAAWAKGSFGSPNLKVAVLDTGTDPFHVDLAGKIDTANSASELTPGSSPCGATDEQTIYDYNFHGSFVSGMVTSNSLGIAAVAPKANVVGVKVLNCSGSGSFADVIAGIVYAAKLPDVDVINMSLTSGFAKDAPGAAQLIKALDKAVNYATSRGKLVVSAAGNSAVDMDHDGNFIWVPAQSGNGLGIYATNNLDNLASYSNHGLTGTWVGAPGGDLPNTSPPLPGCVRPTAEQALVYSVCSSFSPHCGGANDKYLAAGGTSFSTPMVAGTAEAIDARSGGLLSPLFLKLLLAATADDLGARGPDNLYSFGRVSLGRAAGF